MENKKMKIMLVTSLVTNMLFIGAIAGYLLHDNNRVYKHPRVRIHTNIQSILPETKLAMFEETSQQILNNHNRKIEEIRNIEQKIEEILTAPSFDSEAFTLQTDELAMIHSQNHNIIRNSLLALFQQLTKEERINIINHMQRSKNNNILPLGRMLLHQGHHNYDRHERYCKYRHHNTDCPATY